MQTEQGREHLQRLADALNQRGLRAVLTESFPSTLWVENSQVEGLSDYVACTPDDQSSFVWASGHPIAAVDDIDQAVRRIAIVLRDVAEDVR